MHAHSRGNKQDINLTSLDFQYRL